MLFMLSYRRSINEHLKGNAYNMLNIQTNFEQVLQILRNLKAADENDMFSRINIKIKSNNFYIDIQRILFISSSKE